MVNKKYRQDSKDRYKYKQYIYRSIGGIVPPEMAEVVTENQTAQWEAGFAPYHKLRVAIKEICKADGIPNIKWGMYIAFGERLLKSYLKMKAGSASSDMIAEYINNAISSFSSRTGISQDTAQKIADFITANY
jgi:hypothetical protein